MRILIIGGTGFSGPHIVRRLTDLGHKIALFHRGQTKANLPTGVQHILGDQEHLEDFAAELRRFGPHIVLHMIAITEQHARRVMNMFRGIARRVVAISSQDVYRAYGRLIHVEPGPLEPVPITEDSPLRTKLYPYRDRVEGSEHRLYHYEKILVEKTIMGDEELPGTILRYPMVYGPKDNQHRLFQYLKRMDEDRPAILLAEGLSGWRWTKGYVENAAAAVALAVTDDQATGRVYNVGERETLSEAEWVRAIGDAAGWHGEIVTVPQDHLPPHLVPDFDTAQHLVTDTNRIRQELGYEEPVPRDEALRRTVAWERRHPPKEVDPKAFDYAAEDAVLAELG